MGKVLYCPSCGTVNENYNPYCSSCGYKFPADVLTSFQKPSSTLIHEKQQESKEEHPTKGFITNPPFGFLLFGSSILLFLCTVTGFVAWAVMLFESIGFLIFGIVSAIFTAVCFIYLLYCIFAKNYLIRKMNLKTQFTSYNDNLEKNLELLFNPELFQGTVLKAILHFLTVLFFIIFLGSMIAGFLFYFLAFGGLFYYL